MSVPPSMSKEVSGTVPALRPEPLLTVPVTLPVRSPTKPPVAVATPVTVRSEADFRDWM